MLDPLSTMVKLSVAFYLDINQTGTGSEQPYYEIHALEIYTSASAEFDYFDYKNDAATHTGVSDSIQIRR